MITKIISPKEYYEIAKSGSFLDKLGKVSSDKGKEFLKNVMKEINPDEFREYLNKLEQIRYLTKEDKKELLFNFGCKNLEPNTMCKNISAVNNQIK